MTIRTTGKKRDRQATVKKIRNIIRERRKKIGTDAKSFFRKNLRTIIFVFIFINLSVISTVIVPNSPEAVQYWVERSQSVIAENLLWALLIGFFIVVIECVFPIPSAVIYAIFGIAFGPIVGGILVLSANLAGTWITCLIGRNWLRLRVGRHEHRIINSYIEKYGSIGIFLLRINPLTSSDFVSYIAGSLGMPIRQVIVSTMLGLTPLIFFQTFTGGWVIRILT